MPYHACARRRRRPAGARPGSGPGPGLGLGLSSGSGSLPSLVLFELGLTGMGYAKHPRSAIRIRTTPPTAVGPVV